MARARLLKRLKAIQESQGRLPELDAGELVDTILEDVQDLLNTIKGTVLINKKMGLSDVKSLFVSHGQMALDNITQEILYNIQHFEKRIDAVQLEKIDLPDSVNQIWNLYGNIVDSRGSFPFNAEIILTPDGRIQLKARD